MGLMPSHIRMFIKMQKKHQFSGAACVLGNQEVWATPETLEKYCKEAGFKCKKPASIHGHTSRLFEGDPDLSRISKDFIHARTFFEVMGFDDYVDVDNFEYDQPALLHDMNSPVPEEVVDKFDLVLDGGTVEHIFDIKQVMGNMVRMTRVDGCVMHLASYDMDHGFYALSPCFLYDYYRSNGFSDFSCYIMATDYSNVLEDFDKKRPYFEYEYGMDLSCLLSTSSSWLIFFTARKVESMPELRIPTQGMFEPTDGKSLRQSQSSFRNYIPGWLQPLLVPVRPWLRKLNRTIRCWKMRRAMLKAI